MASAIEYEVQRQIEAYEDGIYREEVIQETRLFDVNRGVTKSMRGKEEASDYRYFPDPDLRAVVATEEMIEEAKDIPELPDQKIERYITKLGIKRYDAEVVSSQKELANFFEDMLKSGASPKIAINWLTTELLGRLKRASLDIINSPISSSKLAQLVIKIERGKISGKGAKDILDVLMDRDEDIDTLIDSMGLAQVSDDGAILKLIDEVLEENRSKVDEYRGGKEKLFGFFVGQVMKRSRGSANPKKVNELLKQKLS